MNDTHDLIDKSSSVPIYQQIINHFMERVNYNEWQIGDKLPSETTFAAEYGVSRITVRQALAELEKRRIIKRQQGKGAYLIGVTKPFIETLDLPAIGRKKLNSENSLLEIKLDEAPPLYVKEWFNENDAPLPLIYICRTFSKDGYVIGLNHVWIPYNRFSDIIEHGLIDKSVSTTFKERYNCNVLRIDNSLEAVNANVYEATLLNVDYDTALIKILSSHYDENDNLVHFSNTLWVGDLIKFQFSAK